VTEDSPEKWAFRITHILNVVLGPDRFPINVVDTAKELSIQLFPNDPITFIGGDNLPGFDGAIMPDPKGNGWIIIYNNRMSSAGRINFTLAHEFGHYLLHRLQYPHGLKCSADKIARWDSEYGQVENQANIFASNLLMPLDDFRKQIAPNVSVNMDMLSACADRYGVSLIATILRWLGYTERRAVLVVSRDGFILWARSSKQALKTGAYFKTSGPPIPVHSQALASKQNISADDRGGVRHPPGIWFPEDCTEISIISEQYDFAISLINLENGSGAYFRDEENEDVLDFMRRNN